jgi:hypothetical protein
MHITLAKVDKDSDRVQEANKFCVPIVKPSFLTESSEKNAYV